MTAIPRDREGFSAARWLIIAVFLCVSILYALWPTPFIIKFAPIAIALTIFIAVWLHGTLRYGLKNIIIFFIITWLVSNFFEAFSIQTGFPFGHYYYDQLIGPRVFEVPLIIMFAYFGTGYASWILAQVLLDQQNNRLAGTQIFSVPLIASFIMVMWDVCMDPLASTLGSLWVWRDGGPYFGVPLQNYFGWFLVVYIFYQLFALYLTKFDVIDSNKKAIFSSKIFWLEMVAVYFIQGLSIVLAFLGATEHRAIYGCMALITVFTMMFVTIMAYLKIKGPRSIHCKS